MNVSLRQLALGIATAGLLLGPAGIRADGDIDPDYYRQTVFPKNSGVYEHSGVLYVQSVCDIGNRPKTTQNKLAAKRDALLGVDSQLKSWAIANTERSRGKPQLESEGLVYAEQVLSARNREWRFASWKLDSIPVRQQYCSFDGNRFVAAFAIPRETLLAKLPPAFGKPCSGSEVLESLPLFLATGLSGKNPAKALAACGVCDRVGTDGVDASVAAEFKQANAKVADYFASSDFGKSIREEERRLSQPTCVTNRTVKANAQGTRSEERIEIVKVCCIPRFQRLLLDLPGETNAPLIRLASGNKAVAAAFDKACAAKDQEALLKAALEENPGDKELWNLYGRALMNRGDNVAAISCFRNALKLDGSYAYPQVNLAKAYMFLGFKRLAWGLAVSVLGVPTDAWSQREARALLLGGHSLAAVPKTEPVVVKAEPVAPKVESVPESKPVQPQPQPVAQNPVEGFSSSEVDADLDY